MVTSFGLAGGAWACLLSPESVLVSDRTDWPVVANSQKSGTLASMRMDTNYR